MSLHCVLSILPCHGVLCCGGCLWQHCPGQGHLWLLCSRVCSMVSRLMPSLCTRPSPSLCLCTRVCSMVSRLMPATLLFNTLTRLHIITHSRTAVFISTFFSVKLELFLKKGGVIQSLLPTIGLDYFIQPWSRFWLRSCYTWSAVACQPLQLLILYSNV